VALDATLAAPLPKDLAFAHGACLGVPCMTAWLAVFGDGTVQGQRVLVTGGAGSVGFYAVQLASWGGAKVAATVSGEEKAAHARRAGAELVLNYRHDDVAGALREWSGGEGVARVVEVDLGANLPVTLEALRVGGVVSMYSSVAVPEPKLPALGFMFKNATLHFLQLGAMPLERRKAAQQGIARWHAEAAPIHRVAVKVPLAETAVAHEAIERGERLGAVVVEI
jgi:NADPH2:quinone reductase